ncbi:MAG: serine hydroxymethyltransferase [Candidatus Pacebacteria bacterium]|nr:serine hydroxymethyltransferase [Candidatus Paceibacterota bacterium]
MKDKRIEELIKEEGQRQKAVVNLIASENYVSKDVLEALGSELTNKYAEGYPGKRYYGGNKVVDKIEEECQERALKLFNLNTADWAVNVQPLSGSPANLAVYSALVPPGGKIMGMSLSAGGHLTHGQKVSVTGKIWQQVPYGVDKETGLINYDEVKDLAIKEKPHLIVAGFTAYPRVVEWAKFRDIADECGAVLMVDMSHVAGLVAGGAYPSPFPYADVVTTTTHKTLRGPRGALIFSARRPLKILPDHEGKSNLKGIGSPKISLLNEAIDKAVFPGLQGGPHLNQIAAVAVALNEAMTPEFKQYAEQVIKNAGALAGELSRLGWKIISGGTDSHLILMDTWMEGSGLSGKVASEKLEAAGIIVNMNAIPGETRSPMDPSGIRLGTAAETTRGKTAEDMIKLAQKIDQILKS